MKKIFLRLLILSFFTFSCQEEKTVKKAITNKSTVISKPKEKKKIFEEDTITIEYLNKNNPYEFDTKLSNGYNLEFTYFRKHKDSMIEMCLNLKKGSKTIDTLNTADYQFLHKNLGYIGADFNEYFTFVNSFGSGNPHEMRLIRKSDAKIIKSGFIVNFFKKPELLLYTKGYDSLMLYDIEKNKDNYIENLNKSKEIDCMISELFDRVKIVKANLQYISIQIENNEGKMISKKYPR